MATSSHNDWHKGACAGLFVFIAICYSHLFLKSDSISVYNCLSGSRTREESYAPMEVERSINLCGEMVDYSWI